MPRAMRQPIDIDATMARSYLITLCLGFACGLAVGALTVALWMGT